ncbi:hypothetical protein Fmac_022880 [Flemingia macrophylla]|uniref:Cytochrome P450 n=1 Tax=Flemingia macrophylla TaxID=520843 RepID=A0ABD1LJY9_9FABA
MLMFVWMGWTMGRHHHDHDHGELPPGPTCWPVVGNIFQVGWSPHESFAKLAHKHGPIMTLWLGSMCTVVISSSHVARDMFKNHDVVLAGRKIYEAMKGDQGNEGSLVTSQYNSHWRMLKRLCTTEFFVATRLDAMRDVRARCIHRMMHLMEEAAHSGTTAVDVGRFFFFMAFNLIGNLIFSKDLLDSEMERGDRFYYHAVKVMEYAGKPNVADYLPILKWLDPQGTDTTTSTMEWAMAELLHNPRVLKKVQMELRSKIGPDRNMEEKDIENLPYLQAVIKETLRLHPPLPFLVPHMATDSCDMLGYNIPKESQILVNVWAIGRDPKVWDAPLLFWPERFMEPNTVDYKGRHFEFIPFGSGRRMCPAMPLASRVLPLALGSLLHSFDWLLPDGLKPEEMDMTEGMGITLRKALPLKAIPVRYRGPLNLNE